MESKNRNEDDCNNLISRNCRTNTEENDSSLNVEEQHESNSDTVFGNEKGNSGVSDSRTTKFMDLDSVKEKGSVSREVANPDGLGLKDTELGSSRNFGTKMKGIDLDCDGIGNEKESDRRVIDEIRINTFVDESNPVSGENRNTREEGLKDLKPEEVEVVLLLSQMEAKKSNISGRKRKREESFNEQYRIGDNYSQFENGSSPFDKAMKTIEIRAKEGIPTKDQVDRELIAPLLQDLCVNVLVKEVSNAKDIASLECVPDELMHKICRLLCDSRKMDHGFMNLIVSGYSAELCIKNCSQITEEELDQIFKEWDTNNLRILQLDLCGHCMSDDILCATLARSPNSLPVLAAISLRGAFRLSDDGLNSLVSSAPSLRSINLGQCSYITSTGINTLVGSLGSLLRELYLDDCANVDMMLILHSLKKLEHLEVLSIANNQTVCDAFVCELINVRGPKMKELDLEDCGQLTDVSVKIIAERCPGLRALNLVKLHQLTDSALRDLANGCRSIQKFKLCGNGNFSDEAIAAFLEASGKSLTELSLNNVYKVGPKTVISLVIRSSNLLSLDLSWCRNLDEKAVESIVKNCLSLRMLKLFGCIQITESFKKCHSKSPVQIIGLNLTPLLENINMFSPQEAPLRYYSVPYP